MKMMIETKGAFCQKYGILVTTVNRFMHTRSEQNDAIVVPSQRGFLQAEVLLFPEAHGTVGLKRIQAEYHLPVLLTFQGFLRSTAHADFRL